MLTLLILVGVMLLVLALSVRRQAKRQRALEEERQRQAEAAERGDFQGSGASPFGPFPFGNLFGSLLSGPGGWSRSLAYDPRTGEWVDISGQDPTDPGSAPSSNEPPDEEPSPGERRRRRRASHRPSQAAGSAGPLGSLFGGGLGGMGGGGDFEVEPSDELGGFDTVGGMEKLKQELRETVGLMLEHPEDAERYGIEWNGILLHGPPGVGKTYFARAIAGEHGLNLMHVSTGDLVSSLQGGSARNIDKAFETALGNLPCLLFFDEFDSIAQRRDNTPDQESRRTVNQLLTSLEAYRDERELLVMAATNSIEHLDPAVIRPGRFDRHIRIDLPDEAAREAIVRAELDDRPTASGIEIEQFVRRTEGMTPAAIEKVIDAAALDVFREATRSGQNLELTSEDLLEALERHGGEDRPMVEHWSWDSLILPQNIKAQLQQLQSVIEDPERATRFGVDPPTGLLLAGPPGTGKTSVAKVLAAQARCSFYPVSGADVMSKWVGESERKIRQLFERARENRPSIVFIDEIDALAGSRGQVEVHDSHVNQLLAEIDGVSGQRGVLIIGATNRPDQLDPAIMRGGRLSRTIILGLPDEEGRLAMLCLHSARMPTVGVRFEEIAREAEGMSPADLKALCQEAALAAMARTQQGRNGQSGETGELTEFGAAAVSHEDFEEALRRLQSDRLPVAPL
jgi:SpoVK/Ycf46/Vps4 family AAA+-type ATPase